MKVLLLLMLVAMMRLGVTEDGGEKDNRTRIPCKDGSRNLFESDWCDGYCDCDSCEDEAECEGGIGITSVEWGDMAAKLNAKLPGGELNFPTKDFPMVVSYVIQPILYYVPRAFICIIRFGNCDW